MVNRAHNSDRKQEHAMFVWLLFVLLSSLGIALSSGCSFKIPANYSNTALPIEKNSSTPISVRTTIFLSRLDEIDDLSMTFTTTVTLALWWNDQRLITVPGKDPMRCRRIILDSESAARIWKPAVYIFDNVHTDIISAYDESSFIQVFPTSKGLSWVLRVRATVGCDMDFNRYPLDKQDCKFVIGSLVHKSNKLHLNVSLARIAFIKVKHQYYFDIEEIRPEMLDQANNGDVSAYKSGGFKISLRRKVVPFILNYYFPTGQLVAISWISYFIPSHMVPGRMALLVTVLLTIVNLSSSARDGAPKADKLTALDVWLLACLVFVAGTLFEYAILLRIRFSKMKIAKQSVMFGNSLFLMRSMGENKDKDATNNERNIAAEDEEEERLIRKCALIDNASLLASILLFVIFNIVYWAYTFAD